MVFMQTLALCYKAKAEVYYGFASITYANPMTVMLKNLFSAGYQSLRE